MTKFDVTIRSTSITVYPGKEAADPLQPLINLMEYDDDFEEVTRVLGYIYDESQDLLYFHKGIDLSYLKRLLINVNFIYDTSDEYDEMSFEYEEIVPPRNDTQVDVIDFISGMGYHQSNKEASQLFLVQGTGMGKTYCSGVGLCKFKTKTLIIVHRDTLREQWKTSLREMSGLTSEYVHIIESGKELFMISQNKHNYDYDVYIMTHATFRSGLRQIGNMKDARNITKNLKIGFKIIDEAHLEFRDTLMMDFVFNVSRNLYLTATDGRSNKDENSIFKHVFSNAVYYKKSALFSDGKLPSKWVNYYTIHLNTHTPSAIDKFRVAGGRGMNPNSYGKWVIQRDKKQTHINVCKELLQMIFNDNSTAKVLIFMPLIDLCEDCAHVCRMGLNYNESFPYDLNIKTINSKNTKMENLQNKRADVIVTTIGSCGTGTDIVGITDIICCSPFKSQITAEQVFGRIRYCGKICHYYDIIDDSIKLDKIFHKIRFSLFRRLALKCEVLYWTDDGDDKENK